MAHTITRRHALELGGTAALVGLAGCTVGGVNSGPGQTPTDTHEESGDHHDDGGGHHDDGGDHHDDGGDEHTHTEVPDGPAHSATVAMETDDGQHFVPHVVWVEPGATVTFVNESGAHSATAYHPDNDRPLRQPESAGTWDSGILTEVGAEYERTFDVPGVYDYYCAPHESVGMVGTVVVGEPDPHDQPGLAEPQASLPEGARATIETLNERVNEALGHTH